MDVQTGMWLGVGNYVLGFGTVYTERLKVSAAIATAFAGAALSLTPASMAADSIKIEVTRTITPFCSASSAIDCNAPIQYSMQPANRAFPRASALAAAGKIGAPSGIPIEIPLTLGGAIDDVCGGKTVEQGEGRCKVSNSGRKIAVSRAAEARISWDGAHVQMMTGQYSGRLAITVGLRS
jgi:hypothetical protein